MNRHNDGSILLFLDFDLMLIDPAQLDLVKCRIALDGCVMAVQFGCEIDMSVARNHYVDFAVLRGNREFIGRILGRLRRDKDPGTDAWVCGAKLKNGEETEQYGFVHGPPGSRQGAPNNNTRIRTKPVPARDLNRTQVTILSSGRIPCCSSFRRSSRILN